MPPRCQHRNWWRSARGWTALLLCASPLGLGAQEAGPELGPETDSGSPTKNGGLPALDLLIEGSVLQKVTIPSYDDGRRLSSVLRAGIVTLTDRDNFTFEIDQLRISVFDEDRGNTTIAIANALLKDLADVSQGAKEKKLPGDNARLLSSQSVTIDARDFSAEGTGIVFYLNSRRGFLQGPARVQTLIDTRTSMIPFRPTLAMAAVIGAAAAAPEGATIDPQVIEGLDRIAESRAATVAAANEEAETQLSEVAAESERAEETLTDFLKQAALDQSAGPKPDLTSKVPDPENPPKLALPATIDCDGGVYFDPDERLLIFLENVRIDHPEFKLSGADEVKVFFESKATGGTPPTANEGGKDGKKSLGGGRFGEPARMVATGTVVAEAQADPDDKDADYFRASGRQFVYDFKGEELIIRGGQPWIISNQLNGRITDPDGMFRINRKSGEISANRTVHALIETEEDN